MFTRESPCNECPLSLACSKRHNFPKHVNHTLRGLYQTDNYHAILALLEDYLVIAIAISLYVYSVWLLPITILLVGSRQRALATLLHESSHLTVAKHRILNFLIGTVFSGYWIFQTFNTYQCSHVRRHHRYLGDPKKDPDIQHYIKQGLLDNTLTLSGLKKKIIHTMIGERTLANLRYLLVNRLLPLNWRDLSMAARFEYVLFIAFWAVIIALVTHLHLWDDFLIVWFIPYLTSFQIINWFIELSEHYPLTKNNSYDLFMTRNRLSNPLEKFFTGIHNENWHLTHHLKPGIPFWNVGKAHEIMMTDQDYAEATILSGGLFTEGTNGVPGIIPSMLQKLNDEMRVEYSDSME